MISNQSPAPDESNIDRDTDIAFRITDDPDGVNQSTIEVGLTIGEAPEIPAVVAGVVTQSFDGSSAGVSAVTDGYDVVMDLVGILTAQTLVVITINAQTGLGAELGPVVYQFTTGDAPILIDITVLQIAQDI